MAGERVMTGWGYVGGPRYRPSGRGEKPSGVPLARVSGMGENPMAAAKDLSALAAAASPAPAAAVEEESVAVETREKTGKSKRYGGVVYSDNSAGRRARAGQAMAGMAAYSLLG